MDGAHRHLVLWVITQRWFYYKTPSFGGFDACHDGRETAPLVLLGVAGDGAAGLRGRCLPLEPGVDRPL